MKRNPVIPYALIAVLGILTIIVLSMIGLNQQQQIEMAEEGGGESQEVREPEQIAQSCVVCHGADLAGDSGPSLQHIGSEYSEEELLSIIQNGIEGTAMPGNVAKGEEAVVLAKWLAEKK